MPLDLVELLESHDGFHEVGSHSLPVLFIEIYGPLKILKLRKAAHQILLGGADISLRLLLMIKILKEVHTLLKCVIMATFEVDAVP